MLCFEINSDTKLRPLSLDDSASLFAVIDSNRNHLRKWLGWVDKTEEEKDVQKFIKSSIESRAKKYGFVCCIIHLKELVGICGFDTFDLGKKSTEIGYWLSEAATGKGIMTNCVKVIVSYAFRELNLNRIELRAATENHQSCAIAERLNFTYEGDCRDGEWLYDHFVDQAVYSMLKREWGFPY